MMLLLATFTTATAWAQFGGGNGTWENPYRIYTTDHLDQLAASVNGGTNYEDVHFMLCNDLDYAGRTYTPIGTDENRFCGTFWGSNRSINNVTIDSWGGFVGLFGMVGHGGKISKLTLSGQSSIAGRGMVGGIAGELYTNAEIIDCNVREGVVITAHSSAANANKPRNFGGIVGISSGKVKNCLSQATVSNAGIAKIQNIGGIAGSVGTNNSSVENCKYAGTVNATGSTYVGGLVGIFEGGTLSGCYLGGNCTIGAVGVANSDQGTDTGYDVTHFHTVSINYYQVTSGSIVTQPNMIIGNSGYYLEGTPITLSGLYTFGSPAGGGMIWNYRAMISSSNYVEVLPQEDGTWKFTMPAANVSIISVGAKDITLTEGNYHYTTKVTLTPDTVTYNGLGQKPTLTVKRYVDYLTEGTDFITDIPTEGYTNVGDYPIHIWGIGDYGGLRIDTFTVTKAPLTQFTLGETWIYWDGNYHIPGMTVKSGNKTLQLGTEYDTDMPVSGFEELGVHPIKVWGIGNYTDTLTATYTICHPWDGMGTQSQPFLIHDEDDLDRLASFVNIGDPHAGVYFRQTADLDYTGRNYAAIGKPQQPFKGNYDGGGYTISNVTINNNSDNQGLFGYVKDATLSYIHLANSQISAYNHVGGILGHGSGTIESCFTEDDVVVIGHENVGGIVGSFVSGTIALCENSATVAAESLYYGGIAGKMDATTNDGATISYCFNYGTIGFYNSQSTGSHLGGIVGSFEGYYGNGHDYLLEGCVNQGPVYGESQRGGIAGHTGDITVIDNLNLGLVENGLSAGGIIGFREGSMDSISNNYYAGNCNALSNGIGSHSGDDLNEAMRGWTVSEGDGIFVQMMPDDLGVITGLTHNGITYLGAGQMGYFMVGRIDGSAGNFSASAGTLTPVVSVNYPENYYALTMPTVGQDVTISSLDLTLTVPGYGTSTDAGWRFIASPVAGSIEASTVGNIFLWEYDLYRFDQSEALEWRNHKVESFDLVNGQGYLYACEDTITLMFGGTYNTAATQEVPLVYDTGKDFTGWNLVGNPFAVEAYANKSYYIMNADGTNIEPVAVSSATAIPVCTGVMVLADGDGQSVTFSRTAPSTSPAQGNIQIAAAQTGTRGKTAEDKVILSFADGDQLGKFVFGESNARISIPQDGEDYAIVTVSTTEVPVNFKAAKNGTYTLNVNVENLDLDYLHLIDNMTGADVDLLQISEYTFAAKTADYASRFRLVFNANEGNALTSSETFAYINNGEIVIVGEAGTASLQIVDVMGRVVVCTDVARNVSTSGMTAGVYVLRLIDGDSIKTQKMVIP